MPPEEVLELKDCKELFIALQPYSERHFERTKKLSKDAFLVEFALETIQDEI